jgi:hypothetical protein
MAQKIKRKFEEKSCKTIKIHRIGAKKNSTIIKINSPPEERMMDDPDKLAPNFPKIIIL